MVVTGFGLTPVAVPVCAAAETAPARIIGATIINVAVSIDLMTSPGGY
jgi:hypothetical protein